MLLVKEEQHLLKQLSLKTKNDLFSPQEQEADHINKVVWERQNNEYILK